MRAAALYRKVAVLTCPFDQAASGDFPHLLIYGPSGAGKKTRISATLKALFGPGVEKIKIDARVFQTTR
jgi:replication factor C subunit 3/5